MKKSKPVKPTGSLILRNVENLSPKLRRQLADWLRDHATDLERKDPPFQYAKVFRGRFI